MMILNKVENEIVISQSNYCLYFVDTSRFLDMHIRTFIAVTAGIRNMHGICILLFFSCICGY